MINLASPITLYPYAYNDKNNNLITPKPIVLNELDVSYIYRPKTNMVYAQIVSVPGMIAVVPNTLVMGDISLSRLEQILQEMLGNDPQAFLQSQLPRTLESEPNGPGTILSNMFSFLGIHSTPNCSCRRHAIEMNVKGPDWCEENIDTIIGWLREESAKRKLPFVESIAKMIVKRAIKLSRKFQQQNQQTT